MSRGMNRRDFFRLSAAALSSLWFAPLLPGATSRARTSLRQATTPPSTGSTLMTQQGVLGTPVDVGMGNDGVHWVVTDVGAPAAYDEINDVWQPFGDGIDAAMNMLVPASDGTLTQTVCYFRGGEFFLAGSDAPAAIAERWPDLPLSFQSGVDGAAFANADGTFLLFRQGQYVQVDVEGNVSAARALTSAAGLGWPGTAWEGGRFDYVISGFGTSANDPVSFYFVLGDAWIAASLTPSGLATEGLTPLSQLFDGETLELMEGGGITAALRGGPVGLPNTPLTAYGGPVAYAVASGSPPQSAYLAEQDPNWPAAWHPLLTQAPAGRVGNLWSISKTGVPFYHNGTAWQAEPLPDSATASAVDVGTDGTTFAASGGSILRFEAGGGWAAVADYAYTITDLSIGHGPFIWFVTSSGEVHGNDYDGNNVATANTGRSVTDIGANPDGTIWHCNETTQVYRYLTEGDQPSRAVNLEPEIDSIQKVASTGFGTGFFLAQKGGQAELLRFASAYLCKTGATYWNGDSSRIAVGASSLYLFSEAAQGNASYLAALDTQTGGERWRHPYLGPNDFTYSPLFDSNHQLVYLFHGSDVQALDAQTGALNWSFTLEHAITTQPVLRKGLLFLTGINHQDSKSAKALLTTIDTLAALQLAAAGQPIVKRWHVAETVEPNTSDAIKVDPLPPVIVGNVAYFAVWATKKARDKRVVKLFQVQLGNGEALAVGSRVSIDNLNGTIPTVAPISAQLSQSDSTSQTSLVIAGPKAVYGFSLDAGEQGAPLEYKYIGDSSVTTDFGYVDGQIYFGDSTGHLYGLTADFVPAPSLPVNATDGKSITALTVRPSDGLLIFVGESDQLGYLSPGASSPQVTQTDQTVGRALSEVTGEGVIYVGGRRVDDANNLGQVFGIRTDDFTTARNFIIESQLMQDYDTGATTVARYQTHVTVVDDNNTPRPYTGLKLWADEELAVIVGGKSYTIGPDTPLSTQVDASGTLTILSDATDLFATPLRLWAAFMDPAARIVVYPDEAFHNRLPSMTADANNDDPTTINLATGTAYDSDKPLLSQSQASSAAKEIGKVTSAMGLGSASSKNEAAIAGVSALYKAYTDLAGYRHFSADTPAARNVTPQVSLGLSMDESNNFSAMTSAEAAALIDGLTADVEVPSGELSSFWKDLKHAWDDVKKGVAKIEHAVVSVGKSIYVGLTYVVDGVKHVLRQVVKDIEDVARMIGAFFSKLISAVKKIIELLSLLLHFEQILDTYHILKEAMLSRTTDLNGIIKSQIMPAVTSFFQTGEQDILDAFCTVKKQVDSSITCDSAQRSNATTENSPAVSTFGGVGSTTHSIFTVTPNNGGSASSHSVNATWGLHKVKDHYKQATITAPSGAEATGDPLGNFFTNFAQSLSSNPQLKQAFDQTEQDFAASFKIKSSSEFLEMAIVDLLDILQDLLVSGMVVAEAFLQGLLELADDLIPFLFGSNGSGGVLTQPLKIPIISDLFEQIVKDDLTFFNLIVFIAAIPVTILYRVIEGDWLSNQVSPGSAFQPDAFLSTPLARAFGILEGIFYVGNAFFAPMVDVFVDEEDGAPPVLNQILTGLGVGILITSAEFATATERVNIALQLGMVYVGFAGDELGAAAPLLLSVLGLGAIVTYIIEKASNDVDGLAFSADLLSEIPPFARALEYLAKASPFATSVLLGAIDMLTNLAAAGAGLVDVWHNWDSLTLPGPTPIDDAPPDYVPPEVTPRVYLPAVAK